MRFRSWLKYRTSRGAALVAILGLSMVAASCTLDAETGAATGSFERTLNVDGPVDLDVVTGSGSIRVSAGSEREVRIVARIRASDSLLFPASFTPSERVRGLESNPPIEQRGNVISVGEAGDPDLRRHVSISYDVVVPARTRLRTRSGSGDQTIDAIHGPVDVRAGSGSLKVGAIDELAKVSTGSGTIEVSGASGLEARTGSGSVRAQGLTGSVEVRTGSGQVRLDRTGPGASDVVTGSGGISVTGADGPVRARAGSGGIRVEGRPQESWELKAGSGDIELRLDPAAAFDLDVRTGSGTIETDHPVDTSEAITRRRLQGRVRGGGPRLDVTTGSGSVSIK